MAVVVVAMLAPATGLMRPTPHVRRVSSRVWSEPAAPNKIPWLWALPSLVALPAVASDYALPVIDKLDAPDLASLNLVSGFSHDALVFLAATVVVTPLSRVLNVSPILGYLVAGCALGPSGFDTFRDLEIDDSLAEIGILFLLFEQGLELTIDRLESLRRYAFGLGTAQLVVCSLAFGLFPFAGGVEFLERAVGAPPELVAITRPDEAIVIGVALSLSSSAFVLRLLQEKKQSNEEFGLACLGVLLLQDIAVVPLLVLLPIMEDTQVLGFDADVAGLATSALQSLATLGAILVVGRLVLRRVFAAVAGARSSETFVALCLLVVLGTGALTDAVGLSSTLGAFVAGTLLAETNFRARIEADIQPFRGLLLGLFFVTTGATVDIQLLLANLPTAALLLIGQLLFKFAIVAVVAENIFDIDRRSAVRTALLLAGGGEFAFVVFTLATRLDVLPPQLARLDTAIVVLAMALTPYLGSLGDWLVTSPKTAFLFDDGASSDLTESIPSENVSTEDPVIVIKGFGPLGQTVAAVVSDLGQRSYVAVDDAPAAVAEAKVRQFPVAFGDLTPRVVQSLVDAPVDAFVIPGAGPDEIRRLKEAYPAALVLATRLHEDDTEPSRDELEAAGADVVVDEVLEAGLQIGAQLINRLPPLPSDDSPDDIDAQVDSLRRRILTRGAEFRDQPGLAQSTVSGGGFDLDASKPGAVSAGSRAKAAKHLTIFSGYDDGAQANDDADDGS